MVVQPRCFGVLGEPIAHSLSPVMHQAAFDALGLPHRYLPFRVLPADLGAAVAGLRAMGFGGVNVTVPHKQAVLRHVDRVTSAAERIGAANTLEVRDGQVVAHNTDGPGFLVALAELGPEPVHHVVVLGTGGAARAVVDALGSSFPGVNVQWISRDLDRSDVPAGVRRGTYQDLRTLEQPVDLWVNATPVGMTGGPDAFPLPIPLESSTAAARVIDLVYPGPRDGLWGQATRRGLRVQDGLPLLWAQGVASLSIWLGREVPVHVAKAMREALTTPPG